MPEKSELVRRLEKSLRNWERAVARSRGQGQLRDAERYGARCEGMRLAIEIVEEWEAEERGEI